MKRENVLRALSNGTKAERREAAKAVLTTGKVEPIRGFSWGGELANVPAGHKAPAFRWADENPVQ